MGWQRLQCGVWPDLSLKRHYQLQERSIPTSNIAELIAQHEGPCTSCCGQPALSPPVFSPIKEQILNSLLWSQKPFSGVSLTLPQPSLGQINSFEVHTPSFCKSKENRFQVALMKSCYCKMWSNFQVCMFCASRDCSHEVESWGLPHQ